MDDKRIGCGGHHEDQACRLLASPKEEAAEGKGIPEQQGCLRLVGIEFLLIGHRICKFVHDRALVLLVPPRLKRAIVAVEGAGPPVLTGVDLVGLVDEVGA